MPKIKLVEKPTIELIGSTQIDIAGMINMGNFLNDTKNLDIKSTSDLYGRASDSERLCELAGRLCYNSLGIKKSNKTNADYIEHVRNQKHLSVFYHTRVIFFIGDISRRLSHELIRHHVGAGGSEDGAPSQESGRYVRFDGRFFMPIRFRGDRTDIEMQFQQSFDNYNRAIEAETKMYEAENKKQPIGIHLKRINEACYYLLPNAACTNLIWSANFVAIEKLIRERTGPTADLEFNQFAEMLGEICKKNFPNYFKSL